ncbi:hypothetical protein LPB138_08940 [Urechidicola croceus]|uniref:TPM domain-containing protein n=2 Tax=Urechidicola croceus TaxID=1850246 RepID=A0A1D8P894_9FLAO|nr:hypothetical protein LPB138_08940 [Urechidicola croceus]
MKMDAMEDVKGCPPTGIVFPESIGYVNDFTYLFSENETTLLTKRIDSFKLVSSNEIAIVTLDSVPYNINQFTDDLGNYWGVGKKDKNNGLIILVSKMNRKVRISTGLGTRKILTDSICNEIIQNQMIPMFKEDNFYQGVDDALDLVFQTWK